MMSSTNATGAAALDAASLYARYSRPLLSICRQRFDPRLYLPEDLVHETFARFIAWYSTAPVEIENPLGLLIRIATNIYLNRRRELKVDTESPIVLDQLRNDEEIVIDASIQDRLLHDLAIGRLTRVIAELPVDPRETLDAYLSDRRTYDDIALERGVSRNKVQKDLQRALDAIAKNYGLDRRLGPKVFRRTVDYGSNRQSYLAAIVTLKNLIDTVINAGPDELRVTTREKLAERQSQHRVLLNWCATRTTTDPLAADVLFDYGVARTFMLELNPGAAGNQGYPQNWDRDLAESLRPFIRAAANFSQRREDPWKVLPLDAIVSNLTGDTAATKSAVLAALLNPPENADGLAAYQHRTVEGIARSLPPADQIDILEHLVVRRQSNVGWLRRLTELYLDAGAADLAEAVLDDMERQPDTLPGHLTAVYDDSAERWHDKVRAEIAIMRGDLALATHLSTVSIARLQNEYDRVPRFTPETMQSLRLMFSDELTSSSPGWVVHLGWLHAMLNEADEAVAHYNHALELICVEEQEHLVFETAGWRSRLSGWTLYWRARARRSLGDIEGASLDAAEAVRILQEYDVANSRHATNLVRLLEYERNLKLR